MAKPDQERDFTLEGIQIKTKQSILDKLQEPGYAQLKRVRKPEEKSATFKFENDVRSDGTVFPQISILTDDGRVAEFKSKAIVIPEADEDGRDNEVHALLIDGNGRVYCNIEDGSPAVVTVPVIQLVQRRDPERLMTMKEAADYVGVSKATFKRHEREYGIDRIEDASGKPRWSVATLDEYLGRDSKKAG